MLQSYEKVVLSGDSIKALDYTYSKMYDTVPKEQYVQMIKQQQSSGAPQPKIIAVKQTPMYPVQKYGHGSFTIIDYSMDMQMDLTRPGKEKEMKEMLANPKKLAAYQDMMKGMFSARLGKGSSMEFKKDSLLATIHKVSQYIAINEDNHGWQVIELTAATLPMLKSILPKEILAAYKAEIETLQ